MCSPENLYDYQCDLMAILGFRYLAIFRSIKIQSIAKVGLIPNTESRHNNLPKTSAKSGRADGCMHHCVKFDENGRKKAETDV